MEGDGNRLQRDIMARRNIKLTIAYDGSRYHGWQRQKEDTETVQRALEMAMQRALGQPLSLRAAGRTDTGVHAAGQVANFYADTPIPDERLAPAINAKLGEEAIRVIHAVTVPDRFDATCSARSKLYRYAVFNAQELPPAREKYCHHFWQHCTLEPMQEAAGVLLGEHDFASFASAGSERLSTVRTMLRCQVWRKFDWIYFDLEATGFLYHMVRNVVGTLLEIGRGHWPASKMPEILDAKDRQAAGPMAPAEGLTLQWVKY